MEDLPQDLLCYSFPSLLNGAGDVGTRQDHEHPFKAHIYPKDKHLIRKMEVPIRSCTTAGNLIVWPAKTSRLAQVVEAHHG